MLADGEREGGREGGREGRKQGGELEWPTVPVFGLHGLNLKHAYCSSTAS